MKKVFLSLGLLLMVGAAWSFSALPAQAAAEAKCCCFYSFHDKTGTSSIGNPFWSEEDQQPLDAITTNKKNYSAAKLDDASAEEYDNLCRKKCEVWAFGPENDGFILDKLMIAPILNPYPADADCDVFNKQAYTADYKILVSCLFGDKKDTPVESMYLVYRTDKTDKILAENIIQEVSTYDAEIVNQIVKSSTAATDLAARYAQLIPEPYKIIDYFTQVFNNYNPYLVTKDKLNDFCLAVYKGKEGSTEVDDQGVLVDPPIERSTMQIPTASNIKLSLTSAAVTNYTDNAGIKSFTNELEMLPGGETQLVGQAEGKYAVIQVAPSTIIDGVATPFDDISTVTYAWKSSKADVVSFEETDLTKNQVTLKSGNFGKATITVTSSMGGTASFNVRVSGSGLSDSVLQVLERCFRLANLEAVEDKAAAAAICTEISTADPPMTAEAALNKCKEVAVLASKPETECASKVEEELAEKDSALLKQIQAALDTFTPFGAVNSDQGLPEMIGGLIQMVFGVVGSLTLIMFIYAGIQFMISHGEAEKVKNAKKTMTYAAVGLIVIFGSYTIVNYIMSVF